LVEAASPAKARCNDKRLALLPRNGAITCMGPIERITYACLLLLNSHLKAHFIPYKIPVSLSNMSFLVGRDTTTRDGPTSAEEVDR